MEYRGLDDDDVINVRALNRAWLRLVADGPGGWSGLDDARRRRLADTPFLLFTLREDETELWSGLLAERSQPDLFARCIDAGQRELQVACLAWLWGLARRNPYVARIVAGAPLPWCERVAAHPLVRLLRDAADADLARPRFGVDTPVHHRLLRRGGSAQRSARSAAQVAAMQAMLTTAEFSRFGRLTAAACRLQAPARQVTDEV